MKVIVAHSAGFCWGVKRATDRILALASTQERPVYTFGPLIHNRQVMEELAARRIHAVETLEEVAAADGATVIRAHGVTPETRTAVEQAAASGFMDLTCPLVVRVQRRIAALAAKGYHTIIVGDAGHAEVIGLLGFTEGRGHVVAGPEDTDGLPDMERVCVVAQTTQSDRTFQSVVDRLRERYADLCVSNTICGPTRERQHDSLDLAQMVDRIVVVGGRHSANTLRLVKLIEATGTPVDHVETEQELDAASYKADDVVGVTAGASTPTWMIDRVRRRLEELGRAKGFSLPALFRPLLHFFLRSHLLVALGAAALSPAACDLLGVRLRLSYPLLAALFVFSMHAVNRYLARWLGMQEGITLLGLYGRSLLVLLLTTVPAGVACLVLAFRLGWTPFLVLLASGVLGASYGLRLFPESWQQRIGIRRLKDLPASRDLACAAGWALVTAVLPLMDGGGAVGLREGMAMAVVFLFVLLRTAMMGVQDVQGDLMVGRETFFNVLGRRGTQYLMGIGTVFLGATISALVFFTPAGISGLFYLALPAYVALYSLLYHVRRLKPGMIGEAVVDAQFLVAGCSWGLSRILA